MQSGNNIYSFGGQDSTLTTPGRATDKVYKYDPADDTWTPLANMNGFRRSPDVTKISDEEFLIIGELYYIN